MIYEPRPRWMVLVFSAALSSLAGTSPDPYIRALVVMIEAGTRVVFA